MKHAGSESWRFAVGVAGFSHAALYVRDSVGLQPPAAMDIPPRLSGDLPDRRALLDVAERGQAGEQWPRWLRRVIACEIREGKDDAAGPYERLEEFRQVADPPEFASLAGSPALQKAARATFPEGYRWTAERRRELHDDGGPPVFPWQAERGIAEEVAERRGVSLGMVRGSAVVLMVQGKWWAHVGPGLVACSVAAAKDPELATSIIRTAFETGITS